MKKIVLFLLLSLPLCCLAQKIEGKALLDSMLSVLPQIKSAAQKSALLSNISKIYLDVEPEKSKSYAYEALEQLKNVNAGSTLGDVYSSVAGVANYTGRVQHAIDSGTLALKLYQSGGNRNAISQQYAALSAYYRNMNRHETALKMAEEGIAIYGDRYDKLEKGYIQCLIALGSANDKNNNAVAARHALEEALSLSRQAGNRTEAARAQMGIGILLTKKRDTAALPFLKDAMAAFIVLRHESGIQRATVNLTDYYWAMGRFEQGAVTLLGYAEDMQSAGLKRNAALAYKRAALAYRSGGQLSKAMNAFKQARVLYTLVGTPVDIANLNTDEAVAHYLQGDYLRATELYLSAIKQHESTNDKSSLIAPYANISLLFKATGEYTKALEYLLKALQSSREMGSELQTASILLNIGVTYLNTKDTANALAALEESYKLYENQQSQVGIAGALNSLGYVYSCQGEHVRAAEALAKSQRIGMELGLKLELALAYQNIAANLFALVKNPTPNSYISALIPTTNEARLSQALAAGQQSVDIYKAIGDVNKLQIMLQQLSAMQAYKGDYVSAYASYQSHIQYRDSVFNADKAKELTRKELQYDFGKKADSMQYIQKLTEFDLQQQLLISDKQRQQLLINGQHLELAVKEKELQHLAFLKSQADLQVEQSQRREQSKALTLSRKEQSLQKSKIDLQESQLKLRQLERRYYVGGIAVLILLSFFVFAGLRNQKKVNRLVTTEKTKSDNLLLNILPAEVAAELKDTGASTARLYDEVSVMFTDFVSFTSAAEKLSPGELVRELHECFTAFDGIIERYGLEKIKTIGDAYMAVSGLPVSVPDHASKALSAALEIRDYIAQRKLIRPTFDIRLGIHSGPVVAGIVGVKKFAYDIWGDTVNTAARMEQNSVAGKVNISGYTYNLVEHEAYGFEHRGKVAAKNKGEIDMFFVEQA